MQALFLLESDPDGIADVARSRSEEEMLDTDDAEYLREVLLKVEENREKLDGIIRDYSVGWDLERLGKVERAVLRLALTEILYLKDVPADVAISEAVRIAKKYGAENAGRFVNGILGKFHREEPEKQ